MNQGTSQSRPSVLDSASTSQMEELEEHYNGGDKAAWDRLVNSYGWSQQDGQAVWQWFSQDPEGKGSTRTEGWGSGPITPSDLGANSQS